MLCSSRCRSRLRSVGDLVETGQPMKRPAKKLVESRRFGSSISMLSALRSPLSAPRSSFPDPDFSTKPALSQVLFFQVSLIRGPHFKIYVFTCVRFWGCYMNKKFRLMPNVKRLRPPWTSAHLHNIIVTHAKHFSLSDICPVGKEDGKMSSLSQLPFLLCSSVVVHRLIVNTATAVNVLISPFFVSCLFTQTDRLEQAMAFYTEE